MKKHNRSMLEGPLFSGIVSYTIPIILTSVLQLLFNAADLAVVGHSSVGSTAVAAVGATGALTNLILNLFIGMSVGAGVTVAHNLGGKQDQAVHRTVHTALATALVSGVILTAFGVTFSGTFLKMMGTDPKVLGYSTKYMQIYFGGITFTMVYNFCASMLRAAGDTKSPLIFLSIAGVVNVILNLVFVKVFGMDVDGVALATVISQAISAVLVVIALMRRTDACKLDLKKLRIHGKQLAKILRIGLPAGIQGSLFSISNVMIQSSINFLETTIGPGVMAGNAAASNLDGFVYVIQNAFMQTTVNYVGQNAGAHKYGRIKKVVYLCMAMVTVSGLLSGSLLYIFSKPLLSIYLPTDPTAIQFGAIRLLWLGVPYFLCGVMEITTGALRGIGSSVVPMVISILGVCGLRIVWLSTVFPAYPSLETLYISYSISWIVTITMQLIAFLHIFKKESRKYQLQTQ